MFWEFRQPQKNVVYAKSLKKLLPHLLTVDFACGLFMTWLRRPVQSHQPQGPVHLWSPRARVCSNVYYLHTTYCTTRWLFTWGKYPQQELEAIAYYRNMCILNYHITFV